MRGANLLVNTLANADVDVIFTLSGNQIMPVYDACIDANIRLIHTRHEAAAVFMAEGYAQLTGKLGVALVTAAPGFGNALGPLFMATQGENPVLLLSGDSPVAQDGRGAFQELDQVAVASTLTCLSRRLTDPSAIADDVVDAIAAAMQGRCGPSHLALPFDVLNAEVAGATVPSADDILERTANPAIDTRAAREVLGELQQASRPVIVTGPSLNRLRAGGLVDQMADRLEVPVIAMESPRGLNDPSLGAFSGLLARADYVLSLGKRIDFTTGFGRVLGAPGAPVDVIDPDPAEIDRARTALGNKLGRSVQAVPGDFARAMVRSAAQGSRAVPADSARRAWRSEMTAAINARASAPAASPGLVSPLELCEAVQRLLDRCNNPILIIDGGEFGQWAQASLRSERRIINGPSGAIGGCLCYAIAAGIAEPDTTVVVLMGDGTVGFHLGEFETAHRCGANIIAVIGHDAQWNAEVQIQKREYGENRLVGCELNNTRYDLAASGLGCHPEYVTRADELDNALRNAANSGLPACINVRIDGLPAPAGAGH